MVVAGFVIAAIAALIHVYIFVLESVLWTREGTRKIFGIRSLDIAETTKPLAFNQGFYNLFLAVMVFCGIAAYMLGAGVVGVTLTFAGTGAMVAAGMVLLLSDPSKASAALKQLVPPLIAILLLAFGLALSM